MANKELPSGIDIFSKIRKGNYYYVDKTDFIARLAMKEGHYFLSRPRRFGKTLLVDTLKNLFEGNKDLFKGLAIYDKWDWTVKYPVVRLKFGGSGITNPEELNENVRVQLEEIEAQEGVSTTAKTSKARFSQVIKALHREKKQPVVVLVDEYDKPINNALDMIGSEEVARANRSYLSDLYATIKDCNEDIHFSFLTGVSKFAHAGVSTGLNNLTDITLEPEFSSICGYTDHDIDTVFAKEIRELDREKIREWYNGYSWRGKEKVYNPFGILQLFIKREFESWWFPTGTPSFLIEELKKRGGTGALGLEKMRTGNELMSSLDIGKIKTPALLFQTGYLTIADEKEVGERTLYRLDFPNYEVRESLHQELLDAIAPEVATVVQPTELRDALVSGDFDTVRDILHAAFAKFPREWYSSGDASTYESNYAVTMYNIFMATGLVVRPEDSTSEGRIDLTVEAGTRVCIFELKVLKKGVKKGAAMKQLREKGYADKYRAQGIPIHLIGVEFDPKKRNVKHFNIDPVRGQRTSGRKKSARKKITRKKSGTRKKITRKKTTRKKSSARKKTGQKKGGRKKSKLRR